MPQAYDENALREGLEAVLGTVDVDGASPTVFAEGDQRAFGGVGGFAVGIMPPAPILGVDEGPSEAWILAASVWPVNLYVALSTAASARAAHASLGALTLAVLDALHDDRTLGGAATGILPSAEAGGARVLTVGERRYLTRTLEFEIRH